ncbi:MAG: hypothetical protein AAGC46_07815 [Solirubrobacteraceae bacterium]|nr:hypothetical protein [Patulibacter sp.]
MSAVATPAAPAAREATGAHVAPRPMIVAYGVLAVAATSRSAEQLLTRAAEAPVAYGLSAVSAVVYVVAWLALRRAPRGGVAARVARVACSVELAGVLLVGAASLLLPGTFAHPTVWSEFGVGYGFAPLVLPVAALWWLRAARAA